MQYRLYFHAAPPGTSYCKGDGAVFDFSEADRVASWLYQGYASLEELIGSDQKALGGRVLHAAAVYGQAAGHDVDKIAARLEAIAEKTKIDPDKPAPTLTVPEIPDLTGRVPDEATQEDYRVREVLSEGLIEKLFIKDIRTIGNVRSLSDAELRDITEMTAKELKAVRKAVG